MVAKVNFTAARVDGHTCPAGKSQSFLWDSDTPGLGLRATAAGSKAFIFQGKLHGATVRVTIGSADSWPIESQFKKVDGERREVVRGARQEARRLQTLIDSGIDPREHAAQQRAAHEARKADARRQAATVSEAWEKYLELLQTARSAKTGNLRSASYINDHRKLAAPGGEPAKRGDRKTERGPLSALMGLGLRDLTARRVTAWLEIEAASRPTSAAYAFRILKAFVRWCDGEDEYRGLIPADCVTSSKVKGAVPSSKAKEGDCLQREQLPAWFAAVRQLGNPVISAYLQALLLTGARREELAALKWDDVDFQWRSLHIADKVETETGRVIPLTPYVSSLLAALPRRNEWVFSSPAAGDGKIAEPRYAHNQALAVAGLPHVTLHGLRRSFSTLAEWVEAPAGVIAQIQGHTRGAIAERHYKRRSTDLLRMWHDKIEAWMLEQAGIQFDAEQAKPGLKVITAA